MMTLAVVLLVGFFVVVPLIIGFVTCAETDDETEES